VKVEIFIEDYEHLVSVIYFASALLPDLPPKFLLSPLENLALSIPW